MNDALGTVPSAMPTMPGPDAGGAPPVGQNPLDALEQILQQAKAGKGGGAAAQAADEEAKAAEQKKQEEQAQFLALQEQKRKDDAVAMMQKLEELKMVKQTPQYQARVEQDQKKESDQQQHDADIDGYEIEQLSHTKL